MLKNLDRSPSILASELFGYAPRFGPSQTRPRINGKASWIVPCGRGIRGPPMPFSCQWDGVDPDKNIFRTFFRGAASRPAGRAYGGALNAGQARVRATGKANANPAISTGASLWTVTKTFKLEGQSFLDCSPRTRGQGGPARPGVRPVAPARNSRAVGLPIVS